MVVTVTASTTSGQPLGEESLKKVLGACDVALQLDQDKVRPDVAGEPVLAPLHNSPSMQGIMAARCSCTRSLPVVRRLSLA